MPLLKEVDEYLGSVSTGEMQSHRPLPAVCGIAEVSNICNLNLLDCFAALVLVRVIDVASLL